jgi:RNA polymerase sigma-70 factor (ECF subfamily)
LKSTIFDWTGAHFVTNKTLKGLFLAHRRELQAYLTSKLRDPEVAADLTQEAFLRFAEQTKKGNASVEHARSYLYRTAHNLAVDHTRQMARRKTDTTPNEALVAFADDRPSQEEEAAARQTLERLTAIVKELPERTREVFVLNRIDGLNYAQTAERLGISESAVQKHLAKALLYVTQRIRPQ